ncbi:EAL domain, c-di-GMP-specific phosphodiesterase class I (or its enzymatically inactive variant) [Clostridium acidisoli DSM 12555]|uniref:EAL domain, c-di-GMP-specific phosphodiesterase class I (Or its enzymatically inactive variant) n=1 Tax=Clostridium acidisoli DSM 12555 TaxID=1121291 RepID=A0A1W1XUG0_9CLOT|nr:EAL domain-containing protein [Clostridium acidisoli]SMC27148.1 EAL domain, c-di-GMP-specific phosphodiesterase class I (or its enzymatically inactive variant) [Clostridium acidisoli DSM 12555]
MSNKKEGMSLNINKITEDRNLQLNFEPIVSIIKKSVIGLEALLVGFPDVDGNIISRDEIVQQELKEGEAIELDRLYREKAMESFLDIYEKNKEVLLFIDINISIIDKYIGSGILMNVVNEYGIEPRNIVLQIVEEKIEDIESMQRFINFYRSKGFLIGLKDLGSGFANLDRISYVEPDIIKINSVITKEISYNYYKQEIFKSLINLSKKVGALVIAEDVENESEAMVVMELGADMIQGKAFCDPISADKINLVDLKEKVYKIGTDYKAYMSEEINAKEESHREYDEIINNIINKLENSKKTDFDSIIDKTVDEYSVLECAYILNDNGEQATNTATRCKNMITQKALIFQPAKKGTDHSLKKYYYFLRSMSLNRYVTEPYVSMATGNLCITISSSFKDNLGKEYILCIDFNPDHINI